MLTGLFSLDSIKRAAHQESWYGDGDQRTYNPFQKIHSRTGSVRNIHSDIEARHSQPPIVRGNTNHSAPITPRSPPSNDGYRPPKHASTMPVVPQTGRESIEFPKEIEINPNHNQNNSEDSNATSETIVPPQNTGSESSVRSRFQFRKMFKRHKESENSEDDEQKEPPQKFTAMGQIRATILNSYINVLLIAAPVGIALSQVKSINPVVVFVVNFIAIIPLAAMLSYATEEIALRTGETIGGLLNATFG
jgi:Ca2+:H+ antiporter